MDRSASLCSTNGLDAVLMSDTSSYIDQIVKEYGAIYKKETDSFIVNGVEFDYFVSGIGGDTCSYTLVDKDYPNVWYSGDWDSYIKWKQSNIQYEKDMKELSKPLTFWQKLKGMF